MKELLETIARALVQNPDDVKVVEEEKDGIPSLVVDTVEDEEDEEASAGEEEKPGSSRK